jgi:4-hydroxy-tetrahydrodipicolinate synthase
MALGGLVVPMLTIFGEAGAVDPERNAEFASGLAGARVDHLFVLGSIGEFPSLRPAEREALIGAVAATMRPGTDLWVGCGAPSTEEAVELARAAESAGAAALVAVPPYYLHPTEPAIQRYYRAIRAATRVPLLAYNIPSLVGYALRPEALHALAGEGVLSGVKDTAGAFTSVRSFLNGAPPGFAVLPGDDSLATEAIRAGAAGAVMGTGNLLPRLAVELVRAARTGDTAVARDRQRTVDRLVDVIRSGPFPATDKFLLQRLRGFWAGYRSPYDPLSREEESRVLAALAPYEEAFRRFV